MTDLTNNTTPLGLLSEDGQRRLHDGHRSGAVERWSGKATGWMRVRKDAPLHEGCVYRIPESGRPVIPWDHVAPRWVAWARDADGNGYFYRARPIVGWNVWAAPAHTPALHDATVAGIDPGTCDWRESLVMRPA